MTNPGEDAGQTASSGSDGGASEPTSTSYEAPPIEQAEGQTGQMQDEATQVYQQPAQPFEPPAPPFEQPAYTPPPAYDPTGYQSPPQYQSAPGYPQGSFPPATDNPGFPPPGQAGYPPPPPYADPGGYGAPGAPGYPPPPPYGAPPPGFGAPPPGFGAPPPGFGPPPPGYPAPGYAAYGPPPTQKTNPMAIGSLVASIVGVCCGIGSIVGIVLGFVAVNQIKRSGENGHGLAVAGIAVGVLTLLISVVWTIGVISSG